MFCRKVHYFCAPCTYVLLCTIWVNLPNELRLRFSMWLASHNICVPFYHPLTLSLKIRHFQDLKFPLSHLGQSYQSSSRDQVGQPYSMFFYVWFSVHHKSISYKESTDATLAVLFISHCKILNRLWHSAVATDLGHPYWIYIIPTHDSHQWVLLQFLVLLMMDAEGVRNM